MEINKLDGFNHMYAVSTFQSEYNHLFGNNRLALKRHAEKLRTNLRILDETALSALQLQQFEKLTNQDGLYSIRHVSKINPRVIFTMFDNTSGEIILLSCALEKSTSDYKAAIAKAKSLRKSILEGGIIHEQ